jgi:hypothetical protein
VPDAGAVTRQDVGMADSFSTPVQLLADRLRDRVVGRFAMVEEGAPFAALTSVADGAPAGSVRVWQGGAVARIVDVRLVLPGVGIDSVMLHAFTPGDSAAPHLTSDLAGLGEAFHCFVDLAPRVELATEPAYLDGVYPPLGEPRSRAYATDGATALDVPLRLGAFTSPWIAGVRVPPESLSAIEEVFASYIDHFCTLAAEGTPAVGPVDLAGADLVRRRAQFDPASDEVWDVLGTLVGRSSVDTILALLRDPASPADLPSLTPAR